MLKGRRRIGKSRLTEEFGQSLRSIIITGLPPEKKITAQFQRKDFAQQMSQTLNIPLPSYDDWSNLFWHLARETSKGRVLIVLDEITWLGSKDPTFLGKLKNAWDLHFKKNAELLLILTGSISGWIEKNIQRLCFRKEGILFNEFERIFSDLFQDKAKIYTELILKLVEGPQDIQTLLESIGQKKGGTAQSYLSDLEYAGFITKDFTWNLLSEKESKISQYRLSDNYLGSI